MSLSGKQIAGNQRRTLRAMRERILRMAGEWDGVDQFNLMELERLALLTEEVSAGLVDTYLDLKDRN